jgi:hypothetical protein
MTFRSVEETKVAPGVITAFEGYLQGCVSETSSNYQITEKATSIIPRMMNAARITAAISPIPRKIAIHFQ